MIRSITAKIKDGAEPSAEELKPAFEELLQPDMDEEIIAEFLAALSKLTLSADLLTDAAQVLLQHVIPVKLPLADAIDTSGTGGDQSGSFNFSTAAALLAAACGVPVAKHGNRSVTSKSGSADLLEALGIPIDLGPEEVAQSIADHRFGFMLAPNFHPAMAQVQKVRRKLKIVTVFNFLGPLLNPAMVQRQLVGVFDNNMRPIMAEALRRLGCQKAWVVWGEGGLDEMSLAGKTFVSEVSPEGITERVVFPEEGVLRKVDAKFLQGGDAHHNAKLLEGIFSKNFYGPLVNGVLWNTAAALVVAGRVPDLREGVGLARSVLDSGEAWALLEQLKFSNSTEEPEAPETLN